MHELIMHADDSRDKFRFCRRISLGRLLFDLNQFHGTIHAHRRCLRCRSKDHEMIRQRHLLRGVSNQPPHVEHRHQLTAQIHGPFDGRPRFRQRSQRRHLLNFANMRRVQTELRRRSSTPAVSNWPTPRRSTREDVGSSAPNRSANSSAHNWPYTIAVPPPQSFRFPLPSRAPPAGPRTHA